MIMDLCGVRAWWGRACVSVQSARDAGVFKDVREQKSTLSECVASTVALSASSGRRASHKSRSCGSLAGVEVWG